MFPLTDPYGLVYGQASRAWCHSGEKPLHPVVHLHLIDRFQRICLQKRSAEKEICPLLWDTAVGGHITYGESVEEALYREAAEELGLTRFHPIPLGTYVWESRREKELVVLFAAVGHPRVTAHRPEVAEAMWWTFPEVDAMMGKHLLTPQFEQELPRIREQLLALL